MSVPLHAIDCPYLDEDGRNRLINQYSIHTTNDFALWLIKSSDQTGLLPPKVTTCIQSCILAHTAQIQHRISAIPNSYRVNNSVFDNAKLFQSTRHLMFIYESFNQAQWNSFFNTLLLRLFLANPSIRIKYFNTNSSLFDLHYFYDRYCSRNKNALLRRHDIFEQCFYFQPCFTLETFEDQLSFMETSEEPLHILLIDDFLSLIKPYLNLDRRIKSKALQLTRRLNRLAQKQSLLVISGLILHSKKRLTNNSDERFSSAEDVRCDAFHADQYVSLRSGTTVDKEIDVDIPNKQSKAKQSNRSRLDLNEWTDGKLLENQLKPIQCGSSSLFIQDRKVCKTRASHKAVQSFHTQRHDVACTCCKLFLPVPQILWMYFELFSMILFIPLRFSSVSSL